MALTDKLRNLDQRVLPGTRSPDEDAETYLRRVASSRAISPAQAGDVMAALREHFGIEAGAGEAEQESDEQESEAQEQNDEAEDSDGDKDGDDDKDEKEEDES